MIGQADSTAVLATTFGMMLISAEQRGMDGRTAREIAVLARVLEGRLTKLRRKLASSRTAEVRNIPCLEALG